MLHKNVTAFILNPVNLASFLLPSQQILGRVAASWLILGRAAASWLILGHTDCVGRLPTPNWSGARSGSWGSDQSTAHLGPSSALSELRIRPLQLLAARTMAEASLFGPSPVECPRASNAPLPFTHATL